MTTTWKLSLLALLIAAAPPIAAQDKGGDAKARQEAVEKAKKARAEGKHEEVVALLEPLYSELSGDFDAVYMLADASVQLESFDKAMTYAVKAVELNKASFEANKAAAVAFYRRGLEVAGEPNVNQTKVDAYFEDAVSFSKAAIALKADDVDAWTVHGELCFMLRNFKESAEAYAKAAELDPKNVNWLYYSARGHAQAANHGIAAEMMDKAIKLEPQLAWLHREKGNFIANSGTPMAADQAAQEYGAALKCKEVDEETRTKVPTAIFAVVGQSNPTLGRTMIEGWTQAQPKDVYAWWWLGFYDLQLKSWADASKNLQKAFELSGGKQADAALMAGQAEAMAAGVSDGAKLDTDKLEKAASLMSKAAAVKDWSWPDRKRDPIASLLDLGAPLVNAGKMHEAAVLIEKHLLAAARDDYRPYNSLGFLYRDMQPGRGSKAEENYAKSRDYYLKASELVVKDETADGETKAQVLNDTGLIYHYHFDDIPKGVEYYRKALGFDGNFVDALENLGLCFNKLGKYEEAIPLFEKVLANPKWAGRRVSMQGLEEAKRKLK